MRNLAEHVVSAPDFLLSALRSRSAARRIGRRKRRLWSMRRIVFGVGAAELIGCAVIIGAGLHWIGQGIPGSVGLGLYICRKVIELHGGRIWVEDAGGTGARFALELPVPAS